ncbi:MAG: hypothetical protein E7566_06590 [Ruminococcaceae bacterium]|nr:hypothetical protein [Oscillospiraceae bacterium]
MGQIEFVEKFYRQVVNGIRSEDVTSFLNEDIDCINSFNLDKEEIENIILGLHNNRCVLSMENGLSPYTNVSPDFFTDNTEKQIKKFPQIYAIYSIIHYHYATYKSILSTVIAVDTKRAEEYINSQAELFSSKTTVIVENAIRKQRQLSKSITEKAEHRLSTKTSEVSVTILGIFAGIVLTVVGGFIYSTSVFTSISETHWSKILLVSSVVGFVCIALIVIMFHYIERFRVNTPKKLSISLKKYKYNKGLDVKSLLSYICNKMLNNLFVAIVMLFLLVLMVFGFVSTMVNEAEDMVTNSIETTTVATSAVESDLPIEELI